MKNKPLLKNRLRFLVTIANNSRYLTPIKNTFGNFMIRQSFKHPSKTITTISDISHIWQPRIFEDRMNQPFTHKTPEKKLSIIVPCYNVSDTIEECIDSLLEQDFESYEIILIDDGSTDNTQEILHKKYIENHIQGNPANIRLITQTNHGLGGARNTGILESSGEYLLFVDGDDMLQPNILCSLMEEIQKKNLDILQMGYEWWFPKGKYPEGTIKKDDSQFEERVYETLKESMDIPGFAWGKIIRRNIFASTLSIFFPEDYWFEDTIMHMVVFPIAHTIGASSINGYIYRQNPKGITANKHKTKRCIETFQVLDYILGYYERNHLSVPYEVVEEFLTHLTHISYKRIIKQDEKVKIECFRYSCDILERLENMSEGDCDILKISGYGQYLKDIFDNRKYDAWKAVGRYGKRGVIIEHN